MGLNITVLDRKDLGCVSFSYSGFDRFRNKLARAAGVLRGRMEGFGGSKAWADVDDPLVPLFDHSDCEGEVSPADCARMAPRLRELAAELDEEFHGNQALVLAVMMHEAAKQGLPLVFS